MTIQIKTQEEIQLMRRAGVIVGETLALLRESVKVGMRTIELDVIAEEHIRKSGAIPSFKGYYGFPCSICVSINDEVVHGIPGERVIQDGDVVSIDCGAILNGWHGDAAFTIGVGNMAPEDVALIEDCRKSLWAGIGAARIGGHVSDIGHAVERSIIASEKARKVRYGILEEYTGHGIGTEMHQDPHVPNFGKAGRGSKLVLGLALAVEPMITRGTHRMRTLEDEWTVVSIDGSRGAHWEETFTLRPDGTPWALTSLDGGESELKA